MDRGIGSGSGAELVLTFGSDSDAKTNSVLPRCALAMQAAVTAAQALG